MDYFRSFHGSSANPYELLCTAATLIPVWHYLLGFLIISYCWVLHARYLATPWLASPHLQNLFLKFFGYTPDVTYQREFFRLSDGGTIALDWAAAASSHIFGGGLVPKGDSTTPIVVVLPGLTSDSDSAYVRNLAFNTAKMGWNVVISNHRGLGGVPLTSDFIFNCGWTDDIREVSNHLHHKHPKASLFLIGTSIVLHFNQISNLISVGIDTFVCLGANILVKYLGEDGNNVPVAGAAAICNPWDFLIGDRFIQRTFLQKLYDKHAYSRLANWDGKMHCIRHYHATCDVEKFETVDTFYRRTSSSIYVCNVAVPLLCISALDDPICTRESIPWDEYGIGVVVQLVKVAAFVKGVALAKVVAQKLGMGA
ncbi:embryogenesis-associated protein EMB8-like [Pyrus ussuriensis x Pyrus communis]|uniref:Embryogenesis-associated protein EMB8-like n=1 Tax=Pyrus ussuriensis x Pyrus communis TaxID=2448454 RepID=A0A5N5HF51_9ROSA|nr:embryogenesis-associated protein EMB8-like [Pyrus ussuriensis x Pyrus communis]